MDKVKALIKIGNEMSKVYHFSGGIGRGGIRYNVLRAQWDDLYLSLSEREQAAFFALIRQYQREEH